MAFETLDLGKIIGAAESIKGLRRQAESDKLRDAYLQTNIAGAQQQQKFAAQDQQAQMDAATAKRHYLTNQAIETSPDPKAAVQTFAPEIVQQYDQAHGQGAFDALHPEDVKSLARYAKEQAAAAAGINLQPDPNAQLSAQTSTENARLAAETARANNAASIAATRRGQDLSAGTTQRGQDIAAETARRGQDLTAANSKATNPSSAQNLSKAWDVYQQARTGLVKGLQGTETGPIMGRIPAVTTAQQIGEGAVSAMAPVLKQIFRVAGEGTFTDKDQELLMRMVPTRTDNPAARDAKLQNIDNIIRAKLGQDSSQPGKVVDFSALPP